MLVDNNFRLRLLDKKDLPLVKELREDPKTQQFLGTFCLLNSSSQERWFENLQNDPTKCYLIFEFYDGENFIFLGLVRISEIDYIHRSMCVGGDIVHLQRGKGYAKQMYKLIFDYAFNQLNMHRLYLFVLESNQRAINLYEKLGFVHEGAQRQAIFKDNMYYDYLMMGILKEEYLRK